MRLPDEGLWEVGWNCPLKGALNLKIVLDMKPSRYFKMLKDAQRPLIARMRAFFTIALNSFI